jgi:hypothetical protein
VKEVHQWLEYLKNNSGKLLSGEAAFKQLRKRLGKDFLELPVGRILEQVGAEFYGETGQNEVLCEDILDFFYDALFEYKRRGIVGSGVILTTAHKVKGLEFDNVIILDGQWSDGCRTIDQLEEARRLDYVAVTRAKKSLILFSLQSFSNRFIGEIPDALVQRSEARVTIEDPALLDNHYAIINLDELYISYAAFFGATSPQTRALQKAQIGDLVQFESEASKDGSTTHVFLTDEKGIKLGRLSKQGAAKWLPRLEQIKEVRIGCIHTGLKEDNQGDDSRTKASWLIPIVEVLWGADR